MAIIFIHLWDFLKSDEAFWQYWPRNIQFREVTEVTEAWGKEVQQTGKKITGNREKFSNPTRQRNPQRVKWPALAAGTHKTQGINRQVHCGDSSSVATVSRYRWTDCSVPQINREPGTNAAEAPGDKCLKEAADKAKRGSVQWEKEQTIGNTPGKR